MSDIHKAINAKLKILQFQIEIDCLQKIFDSNVTIDQLKNPESVKVDPDKIEASYEESSYVGHKLKYKDVDISLFTDNNFDVCDKVFECILKEGRK